MRAKNQKNYKRIKIQDQINADWFRTYLPYKMQYYKDFDFSVLRKIRARYRPGRDEKKKSWNDIIIMADTETSKSKPNPKKKLVKKKKSITYNVLQVEPVVNYVVAWTISLRAYNRNIATLYGHKPSEFTDCLKEMLSFLPGDETFLYFHNLSYDWCFLERFLIKEFGEPEHQLNVKSHYPLVIAWDKFILRDSLLLAQRGLEKWAEDMGVEHQKAVGMWDYEKIRLQSDDFTAEELLYIENDTLAGVECIQYTLDALSKNLSSIPLTATGIPRNEVRKRGKENKAHDEYFVKGTPDFDFQMILELLFHGGYSHGNRHLIGIIIRELMKCYDFKSSYPFWLICGKFPYGGWTETDDKPLEYILKFSKKYAFIFKCCIYGLDLKKGMPMPAVQVSKCLKTVNAIADNGRILSADYIEFYCNSVDINVIAYEYDMAAISRTEVRYSRQDYLPRWFTDYVFQCFKEKEETDKDKDPVNYSIRKAKVNSLYGMCAQKPVKDDIVQNYEDGTYDTIEMDPDESYQYMKEKYEEWCGQYHNVMLYTTGIWCTSLAQKALFELGRCCKTWVYSDTDSIYGYGWNVEKIERYNNKVKNMLISRGYGAVINAKGEESWLGIADLDKDGIQEFVTLGAKRYAYRDSKGELKITVAGVPKKGAECLKNDISNFKVGTIFAGSTTGKKMHSYIITPEIYTDDKGNEIGNSIDLNPCDYLLDSTDRFTDEDFNALFDEEIIEEVDVYAFGADE